MKIGLILQYVTLFSLLIAGFSVPVAFLIHREQVKTQIFLALSARYDELVQSSSPDFWLSVPTGAVLRERSEELSVSALRFCMLVSLAYYLFREHHIPRQMWDLMLRPVERRMRSPLFVREWEHLKPEFEMFPDFLALVISVQHGAGKRP